jgi:hypothetical protein
MAKGKLPSTRTTKPLGNQAISSLVIPYKVKEGSKARKEEAMIE